MAQSQSRKKNAPGMDREKVRWGHYAPESEVIQRILEKLVLRTEGENHVTSGATRPVEGVRSQPTKGLPFDELLRTYDLSTEEGVALMCLAEAFLRIPDATTAEALLYDKLTAVDWSALMGRSESFWVKSSVWAGQLGKKILLGREPSHGKVGQLLSGLMARWGAPVMREAMAMAMRLLGGHFVMAPTIAEALRKAVATEAQGYRHSYDMLGEGARTREDGERYFQSYLGAIEALRETVSDKLPWQDRPTISVKLSALDPRYSHTQTARVMTQLVPKILTLAEAAHASGIGLTIDAEETDRLDISLDILDALLQAPSLKDWRGLGLAVQAYQRRAVDVVEWLVERARLRGRFLNVRLVKGAYWDTGIKRAQELGTPTYPVFTRKENTDISYLGCAQYLLQHTDCVFPQFATHNALTVSSIIEMAKQLNVSDGAFEFQRLYGMGDALYNQIVPKDKLNIPCRIYAPIGGHRDLLAYLVRRLLENGANSSFFYKLNDPMVPISDLVVDPVAAMGACAAPEIANRRIPAPPQIYGSTRQNSAGIDLADHHVYHSMMGEIAAASARTYMAQPIVNGERLSGPETDIVNPAFPTKTVGTVVNARPEDVIQAINTAAAVGVDWASVPERAEILLRAADLFERHRSTLMALCIQEGGKTIADALNEVRETVDFCRYYAQQLTQDFKDPLILPGITGEQNQLLWRGRGIFTCISPWNFPLAIFVGQVVAALAAGNTVLAKPATATPLVAAYAVDLLYEAGVPPQVLHFLPGTSQGIGQVLVEDQRIVGVSFTGSTQTAQTINRTLARRDGPLGTLIAETGGLNAMVVDSSSLPEQVVDDIIKSAFLTTGQRCSALRLLFVQEEVADTILKMLVGAVAELNLGDPMDLATDMGPVITKAAREQLLKDVADTAKVGKVLYAGADCTQLDGWFMGPRIIELQSAEQLTKEIFGPVLHVVRYKATEIDQVVGAINGTGYGLTLGIQSRVTYWADRIASQCRVGNVYINRNMVGAVVGSQPFGGQGLSGTGFKAGGPNYLKKFATEQIITRNLTASGGNIALLGCCDAIS